MHNGNKLCLPNCCSICTGRIIIYKCIRPIHQTLKETNDETAGGVHLSEVSCSCPKKGYVYRFGYI